MLEDLDLLQGYYRTSASSHQVVACHQEEACKGGDDAGDYCAEGYEGPRKADSNAGLRYDDLHATSP